MKKRKIGSVKLELICKSREAMLSAVQIYNNPNIQFKAETFTVLSIIAWTYLLHSYFRSKNIDYCYYKTSANGRKKYDKTKYGAKKRWELERCMTEPSCPLEKVVKENIRFLINLRHEIEHQMTTRIDNTLSAKFQACCINYDEAIKLYIDPKYSISSHLSFSLQFSSLSDPQIDQLSEVKDMPQNISSFITSFDNDVDDDVFNNPKYAYRVLFVPKTANRKGQADKVIEFVKANSPEAEGLNKEYVVLKEREKIKYLPSAIVEIIRGKGYSKLNMYKFVQCWKSIDAKKDLSYGIKVGGKEWYWYESIIPIVEQYCIDNNLQ